MTTDLVSLEAPQRALIGALDRERGGRLMVALDACNAKHGRGTVFPAAAGVERQRKAWITKFDSRSPRYTTRVDEVPVIAA
jgi:DNA polymerase V